MKKLLLLSILLYLFCSCTESGKEPPNHDSKQYNGFISRIHTSNHNTDLYSLMGATDLKKYITDIQDINWEKEYSEQTSNDSFNYPSIEVLDTISFIYLSITITPKKENIEDFQFCLGLGVHLNPVDKSRNYEVGRKVKLFLTNTNSINDIEKVIKPFFNREYELLKKNINSYIFLAEIDDSYQNVLQ